MEVSGDNLLYGNCLSHLLSNLNNSEVGIKIKILIFSDNTKRMATFIYRVINGKRCLILGSATFISKSNNRASIDFINHMSDHSVNIAFKHGSQSHTKGNIYIFGEMLKKSNQNDTYL